MLCYRSLSCSCAECAIPCYATIPTNSCTIYQLPSRLDYCSISRPSSTQYGSMRTCPVPRQGTNVSASPSRRRRMVLYIHYPSTFYSIVTAMGWAMPNLTCWSTFFKILHTLLVTSDSIVNDLLSYVLRIQEDMLTMKAESGCEDMQPIVQDIPVAL
jgi:hypothetical protein